MSHIILNRGIGHQFRSFSRSHPIIDIFNESLVGTKFYEVSKNRDILGDVVNKIALDKDARNMFIAAFYQHPDVTTIVILYNVEEPRLHTNSHSMIFSRHFYERVTIQMLPGQPEFTQARPLYLDASLGKYQLHLLPSETTKESETGLLSYRNDNLIVYIHGPLTSHMAPIETAFRLLKYSNAIIMSLT